MPGLPRGFPLRARAAAEEAAVATTVVTTPAATHGSASGSSQPYRVGLNPFGLIDQFAMLPSEELDQVYNTSCLPFFLSAEHCHACLSTCPLAHVFLFPSRRGQLPRPANESLMWRRKNARRPRKKRRHWTHSWALIGTLTCPQSPARPYQPGRHRRAVLPLLVLVHHLSHSPACRLSDFTFAFYLRLEYILCVRCVPRRFPQCSS